MALEPAEIQMGDINVMDNKDMRLDGSTSFQPPATPVTTYTSPSGSNKRSWVWAHFIEIENGTSVKCTVVKRGGEPCGRVLKKDKTGSTKSMHEHLMALHKLGDPQKRARTEASIDKYLSKNAKSIPHPADPEVPGRGRTDCQIFPADRHKQTDTDRERERD
ncbi:methylthioribulose-1-phosphate dehydratase [Puccinia sorghi]|uniref:Methylthioribulose-1-phosphate dehydratase n=1 Tax=Puccinia sorghi TaxID=27349 RepID=A0A0L6V2V4_9BASI|nr:methylthioribulose-1-phosphate dehydratase [Puccinia sorghi]